MRRLTFLLGFVLLGIYTLYAQSPATIGTFTNECITTADVGWTNPGTVNTILVFAKAGSAITVGAPTADIATYISASTVVTVPGTAYQNDVSAFLVYNSTSSGNSVSLSAMTAGTTYHFLIYNATGTTYSSALSFSGATLAAPGNVASITPTPTSKQVSLSFTNPSTCFDDMIIVGKTSAISGSPSGNGSAYATGSLNFGAAPPPDFDPGAKLLYMGTTSPQVVTNLTNGQNYNFKIFTRKNSTWSSGLVTTSTPTILPVSAGAFPQTCIDAGTATWTNPSSVYDILIFAKAASAVSATAPTAAASTYTASTVFGSGTAYEHDASAFCIYKGSSNSVAISNLVANTTYHYLAFNVDGASYSTPHAFSDMTRTTVADVTGFNDAAGEGAIDLSWSNPVTCFDEMIIAGKQGGTPASAPSGNGSAYTGANLNFSAAPAPDFDGTSKLLYKGSASPKTITNLINGSSYTFKIWVRRGATWSSGTTTTGTPVDMTPPLVTALNPPDNGTTSTATTSLVLTFNEPVDEIDVAATNDSHRIRLFENGIEVLALARNAATITNSGNQITADISAWPLKANTNYYVLVGANVIEDLTGNDFAGISSNTTWNWATTGATVTPPADLDVCANSLPRTLGDIVIEEGGIDDFTTAGSITLSLNPASGFVFQSGTGSVTFEPIAGNDIATITLTSVTFSAVTFSYTLDGLNDEVDRIRISGLKVSSDGTTPTTDLERSGGTAVMVGNAVVDNIIHATINSGAGPAVPGSITTNPSPFAICVGTSLAGVNVTVGTGTSNLKWYSDPSLTTLIGTATGNANPSATQLGLSSATAGTFTVYVTQTTTCESTSASVTFTVKPKPVADAGPTQIICSGQSVILGGSPLLTTTTTGPYTYGWTGPGSPAAVPNPTLTPPDPGASNQTYNYNLVVTDAATCSSTTSIQQITVKTIAEDVIITKPTQSDFVATENQVVLEGVPVTNGVFAGPGVIQLGNGTYQFNPSAAGIVGSPHTISYTATLANGCSKTVTRQLNVSNAYNVINNLTDKYCSSEGQTGQLSVTASFQAEIENYINIWNTNYAILYGYGPLAPFNPSDANFRNYYGAGVTGSGTNYRFNPSAITKPCPTCDYAYVGVFLRFLTGNQIPYNTPDFLYGGEFVTVNPVPNVSFTGLNSGLPTPTDFCNINQDYQLTANVAGGKFFLDGVEATFVTTGLKDIDGTGPLAIFNPLNAGLGPHTIRFELDPGTTGSIGQACKGFFEIVVNVSALPAISFTGPTPPNSTVFCYAETPVALSASQTTNVTFSGLGVTNSALGLGTFNPNQAFLQREVELGISPLLTPQTFNVVVTYTNATGCTNTDTRTYDVRPLPPAVFTFGPKKDLCYEDVTIPFNSSNASGRYEIFYVRQLPLPAVSIVTHPSKDYNFDPSDIFDLAVVNGADPLSTPIFRIVFTTNDPVKTSCTNAQVEQFTVAPVIPASIAGISDLEIYCANEGTRQLTMSPKNGVFRINGSLQTLSGGETYSLNQEPNGGNFELKYVVTSGTGCTTTETINVTILPSPVADFAVPPKCDGDVIDFVSNNNINADQVIWNFGDETTVSGPVGSFGSTTHQYAKSSLNFVKLTITALPQLGLTCIDSASQYVTVGALPISDFTTSKVCFDEDTEFIATTTNNVNLATVSWDFGDGDVVPEGNASANIIPAHTNGGRTSGKYGNPIHKFGSSGNYSVTMLGRTIPGQGGCPDNQNRLVSILTNIIPTPSAPYFMKSLNGENGFWVPEDNNSNSSWAFAAPAGTNIISSDLAWITNPTGPYLENDQSYMNSPCFDMSAFDRPVISINNWANTHNDDGAVLQYSTNGGQSWLAVGGFIGDISTGLNWFNAQGVASAPGGQSNVAWARVNQVQWLEGKHSLDFIPVSARSQMRFRVAFASRTRNSITRDGFAFNDVKIEERNRTILVENFTNNTANNAVANNQNFLSFLSGSSTSELVKLQYHIGLPTADDINKENPGDPNARAAFYGLTNNASLVPKGYLDGKSQGDFLTSWVVSAFSLRSLVSSPFKISVNSLPTDPDKFAVEATVEATNDVTKGRISLFIAVIEKTVGTEGFVVRKLLPNAAGTELKLPILNGSIVTVTPAPWEVSNSINIVNNQLAVVAFIQDIETHDVLQATLLQNPANLPTTITGLENELFNSNQISHFPNPVDKELTIQLPATTLQPIPIRLVDQVGKIIHDTIIPEGQSSKTLSTQDLAGGIYLLQIEIGKGNIVRKKVMVVHNR